MLVRLRIASALWLAATLLTACGGAGQPSATAAAVPGLTLHAPPSFSPLTGHCGGTNQVRVTPCPVRLTSKNGMTGVVVTVTGPGITAADTYPPSWTCSVCNIARLGSTWLQFTIKSGTYCGTQEVTFAGVNGPIVGYAYLRVKNKYCPAS
jgi:hypothetical protein